MMQLPKILKFAAGLEVFGILMLSLSLFCSTPPPYLVTIGLGTTCLLLGLLAFLLFLRSAMREEHEEGVP